MKGIGYFYFYEARRFVHCKMGWLREGYTCPGVSEGRRARDLEFTGEYQLQRVDLVESIVDTSSI